MYHFPAFREFQMPISRQFFHLQTKNLHFIKVFQYIYQIKLVTSSAYGGTETPAGSWSIRPTPGLRNWVGRASEWMLRPKDLHM